LNRCASARSVELYYRRQEIAYEWPLLSLVYAAGEAVAEELVQTTVGAAGRAIAPVDFPIPSSFAAFGNLPSTGELGVLNPTFSVADLTFTFAGNFGIR